MVCSATARSVLQHPIAHHSSHHLLAVTRTASSHKLRHLSSSACARVSHPAHNYGASSSARASADAKRSGSGSGTKTTSASDLSFAKLKDLNALAVDASAAPIKTALTGRSSTSSSSSSSTPPSASAPPAQGSSGATPWLTSLRDASQSYAQMQPADRTTRAYKSAARRWTTLLVSIPLVLVLGYELYERLVLKKEKRIPKPKTQEEE